MRKVFSEYTFVIVPGTVRSRVDGDVHRISYSELIRLYRIPRGCNVKLYPPDKKAEPGTKPIVLAPDPSGKYDLEAEIKRQVLRGNNTGT